MGYTGLDNWQESDEAADFVFVYKKAKTTLERRKIIVKELKNSANTFNTPGSVNIALAMEAGIVRKTDLTLGQIETLMKLLSKLESNSLPEKSDDWGDEKNRTMHNDAYKRLLEVVN
jgi:hypothetical protein